MELDENGNVRREAVRDQYGNVVTREDGSVIEKRGTDSDTAMLKGFAGAAVERVIWSGATAKAFKALPGGAKVASKIERGGFLKKNAGELAGMVAKSRLTELADEVVGLNVADSESGESFGDWLEPRRDRQDRAGAFARPRRDEGVRQDQELRLEGC